MLYMYIYMHFKTVEHIINIVSTLFQIGMVAIMKQLCFLTTPFGCNNCGGHVIADGKTQQCCYYTNSKVSQPPIR